MGEAKETIDDAWADLGNIAGGTNDDSVDRLKDEVINRVRETITRAHRNPQYRSALRTMLKIIRKYTTKFLLAASSVSRDSPITIEPIIDLDKHITLVLADLKVFLERCASGTALDPLLAAFRSFIHISMASHDSKMKTDIQSDGGSTALPPALNTLHPIKKYPHSKISTHVLVLSSPTPTSIELKISISCHPSPIHLPPLSPMIVPSPDSRMYSMRCMLENFARTR